MKNEFRIKDQIRMIEQTEKEDPENKGVKLIKSTLEWVLEEKVKMTPIEFVVRNRESIR